MRSRATVFAAVTVIAVTMLVGGCSTAVQGSPAVDPVAASSGAVVSATVTSPVTTGISASIPSTTNIVPTGTPIPPVPPRSTSTSVPPSSSPAPVTTATHSRGGTVLGVSVDDIVTALGTNPVAADDAARARAGAKNLAALGRKVSDARDGGLDIWVVLIGHTVDGDLTQLSNAVARSVGGTAVVVTTTAFAVSSKAFSNADLHKAEDVAASASSPVEAASILVDQLRKLADGPGKPGPSAGTSAKPKPTTTPTTAAPAASDEPLSLRSFRTSDGAIGCQITGTATVRCDLQTKPSFTPPKNPHPDCDGVYGSSIRMTDGRKAGFLCVSDTVFDPDAPVLPYGGYDKVGNVMCFADAAPYLAVRCMTLNAEHGFALSPTDYAVY